MKGRNGEEEYGHDHNPTVWSDRTQQHTDDLWGVCAEQRDPGRGRPYPGAPGRVWNQSYRHRCQLWRLGTTHRALDGPLPRPILPCDKTGERTYEKARD